MVDFVEAQNWTRGLFALGYFCKQMASRCLWLHFGRPKIKLLIVYDAVLCVPTQKIFHEYWLQKWMHLQKFGEQWCLCQIIHHSPHLRPFSFHQCKIKQSRCTSSLTRTIPARLKQGQPYFCCTLWLSSNRLFLPQPMIDRKLTVFRDICVSKSDLSMHRPNGHIMLVLFLNSVATGEFCSYL